MDMKFEVDSTYYSKVMINFYLAKVLLIHSPTHYIALSHYCSDIATSTLQKFMSIVTLKLPLCLTMCATMVNSIMIKRTAEIS